MEIIKEFEMKLIAFVKEGVFSGRLQYIERDNYKSKKDFISDLRGNGYKVRYVHTEEEQESWMKFLNSDLNYCNFHSHAYKAWRRSLNKGVK